MGTWGFPKPIRKGKNKFGAKKTMTKYGAFPSKLEAAVRDILALREKAGEIKEIRQQVTVLLKHKCEHCGAKAVTHNVDFSFTDVKSGQTIYCEAKGVIVPLFNKQKKLWKTGQFGVLEIWMGSARKPYLAEVLGAKGRPSSDASPTPV